MMSILAILVILLLIGGGIWGWPLVAAALGLSSVTDKEGALRHIVQFMRTYDITLGDIETAIQAPHAAGTVPTRRSLGDIARTLFAYLGGIFILAGVGTYISMFWDSMGGTMRVLVTLGIGYVLLIVLVAALHEDKFPRVILPLTLASVFMMTGGWFVLIHEVYPRGDNWRAAVLFVFAVMALHQGALFGKYRRTVLAFTTLFFVYGALDVSFDMLGVSFGLTAIVLGASVFLVASALEKTAHRVLSEPALLIGICWMNTGLFERLAEFSTPNWASVITGLCVALAAYGMHRAGRYPRLSGLGYLVGSIMAYTGLFDLVQHTHFELLFLAVTASVLYTCVVLQSRALLFTTVMAMLGFIGYFTGEHFAHSLGWPITLVLMGLSFLGVGAVAIKVKKRI